MATNALGIEVMAADAAATLEQWEDAPEEGGKAAISQLSVLAESAMKDEAPEGSQFSTPSLRDSVEARPGGRTLKKTIKPWKRTSAGWLLARAIVGNPTTPTYTNAPPPIAPILHWTSAKLIPEEDQTIEQVAENVRWSIFHEGHETFPNRFVYRSKQRWDDQVEDVAGRAIENALG